jgi:hypothetical protein
MPRKEIRAAITNYFTGAPGLASVAKDEPYFTPGQAWVNNGLPGTAAFVHIDHQTDTWLTVGGPAAQKAVVYDAALIIQYQYRIPVTGGGVDGWVDDLDTVLDTVVKMLRRDPSLGCGGAGPVWQAGDHDMDIVVQTDLPVRDNGGKIWSISYVEFKVTEIVTAGAP